jgi:hypothetical protein
MVMADGFAWNGNTFDSLSQVAFLSAFTSHQTMMPLQISGGNQRPHYPQICQPLPHFLARRVWNGIFVAGDRRGKRDLMTRANPLAFRRHNFTKDANFAMP